MMVFPTEPLSKNIIVARVLDLLLVSITHRMRWPKPASAPTEMLQSSCGEICPGKVQFDDVGLCTFPRASITVTDLTVTGFVPMFATSHSALLSASPIPVARMAAFAVPPRIIPARTVHTLRDIGIPSSSRFMSQEPLSSNIPQGLGWQLHCLRSHGGSFPV